MKHLLSNASYIKTSLICIAKYIENKKINTAKSNNVKNFQGIGKATWKFVSAFYKAEWDLLIADVHNNIFKQRLSYHYTSKTNPVKSSKSRKKNTNKLAVVATTRWNGTCSMLTSAKLTVGYLVVGITKELNKEPSLHCFSIYINTMWSILQQYLPALMSMPLPHVLLLIYHASTSRPLYHVHVP